MNLNDKTTGANGDIIDALEDFWTLIEMSRCVDVFM